jgi:hypothetical protein
MAAPGPRPQTSVALPAGLLTAFGDAGTAVKAARREVKELQREIKTAVKSGQTVGVDVTRRLDAAMKLEASLTKSIAQQKQIKKGIETTAADANALKFLIGAQALRNFLTTGLPDWRGMAAMVFSSSGTLSALASKHLGEKSFVTRGVRAFGRVAPFAGEAVASIFEAVETHKENKAKMLAFAAEVQSGRYSKEEQEIYMKLIERNQRVFGEAPEKQFESLFKIANIIGKRDERLRKSTIDPALIEARRKKAFTDYQLQIAYGPDAERSQEIAALDMLASEELQKKMQEALDSKAQELGYTEAGMQLTVEQEEYIKRQVVEPYLIALSEPVRKSLLQAMEKGLLTHGITYKNILKSAEAVRREENEKAVKQYKSHEVRKLTEMQWQEARRRVSLTGRIGE